MVGGKLCFSLLVINLICNIAFGQQAVNPIPADGSAYKLNPRNLPSNTLIDNHAKVMNTVNTLFSEDDTNFSVDKTLASIVQSVQLYDMISEARKNLVNIPLNSIWNPSDSLLAMTKKTVSAILSFYNTQGVDISDLKFDPKSQDSILKNTGGISDTLFKIFTEEQTRRYSAKPDSVLGLVE